MGRDKSKDTPDEKRVAKALKGKAVEVKPKKTAEEILKKAKEKNDGK